MNKTSILIVEDDRPIRNLIVTTLKHMSTNILQQKWERSDFGSIFTQSGYHFT